MSGSLNNIHSCLAVNANRHTFLWSDIHLRFISTGQASMYLSLRNCNLFSQRNTQPSSHKLPVDYRPICKPDKPFNYGRSPRSSGPLYSNQHSNPLFGFKIKFWAHNIDPLIKYRIWLLKPDAELALVLKKLYCIFFILCMWGSVLIMWEMCVKKKLLIQLLFFLHTVTKCGGEIFCTHPDWSLDPHGLL
jgi:hypothetical protein